VSELLERAFQALGPGPSQREVVLVAQAIHDSEDQDAISALEATLDDDEAWHALVNLAQASGSSGFVALDLKAEFFNPGADPIPQGEL
jgi:hypothetical protein